MRNGRAAQRPSGQDFGARTSALTPEERTRDASVRQDGRAAALALGIVLISMAAGGIAIGLGF